MPTYEYECQRCGYRFEVFQSISSAPRKRCPKCGGKLKRVIGVGAGVIFKGSGFYATDYRSGGSRRDGEGRSSAPQGKSEGKTVKGGGEGGGEKKSDGGGGSD